MRIAITTPTGNVGRQVTRRLLDAGEHEIVLLARDAGKLKEEQSRGAKVITGDLADADYVRRATEKTETLFWVTPPDYTTDDLNAFQHRLAENAAAAIKANNISRTVVLSSLGAHLGDGFGPVTGLGQVESVIRRATSNLVILRPTLFMENFLPSLQSIAEAGSIYLPVAGDAKISMIATKDIADVAAKVLSQPFHGTQLVPLHGPKEYTFNEVAGIIGETLGKTVNHTTVSPEQSREALKGIGASDNVADMFNELWSTIDNGTIKGEHARTKDTTTRTTMADFARDVMAPALQTPAT